MATFFGPTQTNFDIAKFTKLDDYIDLFNSKQYHWYLRWAEELNSHKEEPTHQYQHAGFAVLLIGFWYFESIRIFQKGESYITGETSSRKSFKAAFLEVFKDDFIQFNPQVKNRIANIAFDDGRCGAYHVGTTLGGIILDDGDKNETRAIRINQGDYKNGQIKAIRINRYNFINAIKKHFDNYILEVKNPLQISKRENFKKAWKITNGTQITFPA